MSYVKSGGALPGGVVGGVLFGVAAAVDHALKSRQMTQANKHLPEIKNSAAFNLSKCVLKAKEVRSGFKLEGFWGPSWTTVALIEGECFFEGAAEKLGVIIGFEGRAIRGSVFSVRRQGL